MRAFDRLARKWVDRLPATALSSQLIVEGPLSLDREMVSGSLLLVDNDDGNAIIEVDRQRAKCSLKQGDNSDSIRATLTIAKKTSELLDAGFEGSDIISEVDPLVRVQDIEQLLERDRIEVSFDTNAPHLRSVCHLPFTELRFTALRMPVDRARRVSRRAMQVLASRSEDWLRVGSTGVTPRVVEALERDETVDLYENRVTARLLDSVRLHLRALLSTYSELSPLVQTVTGPHRKRERLSNLWGRQKPDDDLRQTLQQRRRHVEDLLVLVEGLRESRLYRGVPLRARVQQPIRITNLFDDDVDYRGVRRLWAEWWNHRGQRATPAERRQERALEAQAFFSFAWLALARSVQQLDEEHELGGSIRVLEVATPSLRVRVAQCDDVEDPGSWIVSPSLHDGHSLASILVVAVACELLQLPPRELQRILDELHKMKIPGDHSAMVLLYPGTTHNLEVLAPDLQSQAAYNAGVATRDGGRPDTWLIPVSPLDLESTERIERALRWLILSEGFLTYPPSFASPAVAEQIFASRSFLQPADRGKFHIVSPPTQADTAQIGHDVEKHRRQLLTQLKGLGHVDAERLGAAHEAFQQAAGRLDICVRCPVCGGQGRLEPRSANTFESRCRACASRWGLRHDARSNHRVPYLWIGQDLAQAPTGPGLSRWLGRDVLAEPCQHDSSTLAEDLINPWTKSCTAEDRLGASCARCSRMAE